MVQTLRESVVRIILKNASAERLSVEEPDLTTLDPYTVTTDENILKINDLVLQH